jgi:hypothetical protein
VIDGMQGQRYDGFDALIESARSDLADPMFRQCSASADEDS